MSSKKTLTKQAPHPEHSGALAVSPEEAAAAYARIEPELAAVVEHARVVTDIPRTVIQVIGAVPKLKALRSEIAQHLPRFGLEHLDKLEDYALGTWYAHLMAMPAAQSQMETTVQTLLEEAVPLRRSLLIAAETHAHFGDVDPARVAEIRAGTGHADTAADLVALSTLFRERWTALVNRTVVAKEDVDRAADLGTNLLRALAEGNTNLPAAQDRRVKAYTLLLSAYDQCRRAVMFLRWQAGDADAIAPSLFTKTRPRRSSEARGEEAPQATESVAPPMGPPMGEESLRIQPI